jgi:CO/xanthine dehydrogenase Mo-binding subunit
MGFRVVGSPVQRKEVSGKLNGTAKYIDDVQIPGMLHGATIRSAVPRGRIQEISFRAGVPWHEFVIVGSDNIPGLNAVSLINDDQPFLAKDIVNHKYEPILLIAHENKDQLCRARQLVQISYEPLPAVFDMDEALAQRTIIWGDDNVFKQYLINKGDVDRAWDGAAHIIEGEYSTGAQEHVYIEPNGMLSTVSAEEGVTVYGSLQCPYYVHKALMRLFDLPAEKVRVVQQETGGAFGGKEEYPSMIAGHAALLAWKSGRPVKMVYDREEDMAATTKRHPSRTRHRTAVSKDGRLLAMNIEFTIDGGAYSTLSAVVLSRGTIHATGPYNCPNVRVRSTAVATNAPPHGAFRGFGAPQSLFALEVHMDKIARSISLAPEEFRRRNFLHMGDATATGQVITQPLELAGLQNRALVAAQYYDKTKTFAIENANSVLKKGIGFASFMHGAGFTGSGERSLRSVVELEGTMEGNVRILCSMTEMGQGTNTILAQIAAEVLKITYDQVEICRPDTALVPNSGPTVASRTSMIVGKLIERAAREFREKLLAETGLNEDYSPAEFSACLRDYLAVSQSLRTRAQYERPPGIHWDDEKYEGDAYGAYSWATHVAEVTVDTATGEVQVDNFTAAQEAGRVINPTLAAGQIEGGIVQGLGFALLEKVVWNEGSMANNQMTNYIIPTAMDVSPIKIIFEEVPYEYGAMGAKGIGELPMDGPAPAIVNAISNALGIEFTQVPLLPEDILCKLVENAERPEEIVEPIGTPV